MRASSVLIPVVAGCLVLAGCSSTSEDPVNPAVAPRGTTMTTAELTRQDLTTTVSLEGKVTMNPIFGLVAPVTGQVRFREVKAPDSTPTKPTRVAAVWADGKAHNVDIPAGATFAGRLVEDRSTVNLGMPIVSAKSAGYGIVAEIDSEQAYQLVDALTAVNVQIKHGPGPVPCAVLGTIAALPPGTIPEPPVVEPEPPTEGEAPVPAPAAPAPKEPENETTPSEATGMRLVCTPPPDTRMINGAAATLEVTTASVQGALVAPVEAVAGTQGAGQVEVVNADGTRETKDVVLGITDGQVIEIKSGLTGEEKLAVPGPSLPEAPPGAEGEVDPSTGMPG